MPALKNKHPTCRTCVYYAILPKPGRNVPCSDLKRKGGMNACTKYEDKSLLTCSDCLLFLYATCPYKKTNPAAKVCSLFQHKNVLLDVSINQVKNPINRSLDDTMRNAFSNIMAHVFSFEKAAYESVDSLTKKFEQQNTAVPVNVAAFERIVSRISKLFMVSQLAQLCSLGHVTEALIKHELELERLIASRKQVR